jgi:hypothetical protein
MSTDALVCDSFGPRSIFRLANGQLINMLSLRPGMVLMDATYSPVRVKSLLINEYYRGGLIEITPTLAVTPDHFLLTAAGWRQSRTLVTTGEARWLPGFVGTVFNIILEDGCSVLDGYGCAAAAINAYRLPFWFPRHHFVFLTPEIRVLMAQEC